MKTEYFIRTGKSSVTYVNIPESFKIILSYMRTGELMTAQAVTDLFNLHKGECTTKELRVKEKKEIEYELEQLLEKEFVEKIVIDDSIMDKIRIYQKLMF